MKKPPLIIGLVTALMFVLTTLSFAQKTINACYSKKDGALRIVSDASQCAKHESFISWNQVGPAGPAGPQGPEGPPGGCDCSKTVFLSSQMYNGFLGGLAGADEKCQALANAAGLIGTFKAWLSDSQEGPATRFTHSVFPYKRVDGATVASNWNDLTGLSYLLNPINVDEYGTISLYPFYAWTNTTVVGTPKYQDLFHSCTDWIDQVAMVSTLGDPTSTTATWTDAISRFCSQMAHLYCFQQ